MKKNPENSSDASSVSPILMVGLFLLSLDLYLQEYYLTILTFHFDNFYSLIKSLSKESQQLHNFSKSSELQDLSDKIDKLVKDKK